MICTKNKNKGTIYYLGYNDKMKFITSSYGKCIFVASKVEYVVVDDQGNVFLTSIVYTSQDDEYENNSMGIQLNINVDDIKNILDPCIEFREYDSPNRRVLLRKESVQVFKFLKGTDYDNFVVHVAELNFKYDSIIISIDSSMPLDEVLSQIFGSVSKNTVGPFLSIDLPQKVYGDENERLNGIMKKYNGFWVTWFRRSSIFQVEINPNHFFGECQVPHAFATITTYEYAFDVQLVGKRVMKRSISNTCLSLLSQ